MTKLEKVLITKLARALEAARSLVEVLEPPNVSASPKAPDAARAVLGFLEQLKASAMPRRAKAVEGPWRSSALIAGSQKAEDRMALVTPEGLETLEAWIQAMRRECSSLPGEKTLYEDVRDEAIAQGDETRLAQLIGSARKYFEDQNAKAKKRQDEEDARRKIEAEWKWARDHPLADVGRRLRVMQRKKRAITDAGGAIAQAPKGRGPRIGRRPQ